MTLGAEDSLVFLPQPQRVTRLAGFASVGEQPRVHTRGLAGGSEAFIAACVRDAIGQPTAPQPDAVASIEVGVDASQIADPEGYRLHVRPDGIRIVGGGTAGAFYGVMTLRQLVRQVRRAGNRGLPCVLIDDAPELRHRGLMLDISRDRVPTMASLYRLVDTLAEWKMNQLQLYTEHTFAYRQHREVWQDWSPLTGDEVEELDSYCRDRFVELVPNQNAFGHMARWIEHEPYRHLSEHSDPTSLNPHQGVFGTLCPVDPRSLVLVDELLSELRPHFSSNQLNINCDEARIGIDRSKDAVEERGKGPVYLDYIRQVHAISERLGCTTQMWGDVLIHYPELAQQFPANAVAIMEDYSADAPFERYVETATAAGIPFYLSPGISCWSTIVGNTSTALTNIRRAGEHAVSGGAVGILNTDWGDNGHWHHEPVAWLGRAYGAAVSWSPGANADIDLSATLDQHVFEDEAGVMGGLVAELGDVPAAEPTLAGSHGPLAPWVLVGLPGIVEQLGGMTRAAIHNAEERYASLDSRLAGARMARDDAEQIKAELSNGTGLIRHALRLWDARLEARGNEVAQRKLSDPGEIWPQRSLDREYAALPQPLRQILGDDLQQLVADYRQLWLRRSREGGLAHSVSRFEQILAAYRTGE